MRAVGEDGTGVGTAVGTGTGVLAQVGTGTGVLAQVGTGTGVLAQVGTGVGVRAGRDVAESSPAAGWLAADTTARPVPPASKAAAGSPSHVIARFPGFIMLTSSSGRPR
jgi:hypothetical protein